MKLKKIKLKPKNPKLILKTHKVLKVCIFFIYLILNQKKNKIKNFKLNTNRNSIYFFKKVKIKINNKYYKNKQLIMILLLKTQMNLYIAIVKEFLLVKCWLVIISQFFLFYSKCLNEWFHFECAGIT